MIELHTLLHALNSASSTNVAVLLEIIKGIYRIGNGGVTMKNISRWTPKGCSYRTIQRFFSRRVDWLTLNILLFQSAYFEVGDKERYLLAFDETVEDKAGKSTWGVNWFYSSIASKVIRSVSSHVVSLVDSKKETSFVITHEQTVKSEKKKTPRKRKIKKKSSKQQKKASVSKKKPGRPKGSKNKQNVKSEGLLYGSFEKLLGLVVPLLQVIGLSLGYVLADGAYGNKTCCLICREFGLDLISKLNRNTALFLPYTGKYSGRGRKKKYGEKIDYQNIDSKYLLSSNIEDGLKTCIYQVQGVWSRRMPFLLNVVIIVKTDIETEKSGRVVLFSTDLTLTGMKIIRFYSLRFQIEFNFRDAKQYFGLSDFKNTKETQVNNAIGLSLFMDNVSLILIEKAKEVWNEDFISIQDLKAHFRAEKYIADILNTLEIPENVILNHETFDDIRKIGAINRRK
jgi:putative transposase